MSETRSLVERAMERVELRPFTLEGFHDRRERKRRNQRIAAGVVAIAIFVAAIWIVTTGGPFDRSQAPAATGGTVPTEPTDPPHPTGAGLLGLPPEGAAPSVPEHGELVLGMWFGHTAGDFGRFSLHVYTDGRLIWQRLGLPGVSNGSTGLIEQRLTPEGVDLVLAEALSTGLFDRERELVGADGLFYGGIEVRAGARLVHLTWGDAGFEQGGNPIETSATSDQVRALERLDARLEDPTSWLPASAWDDPEVRSFVPSRYQVCYMGRDEPLERPRILDLLPPSAGDLLRDLEETQHDVPGPLGSIPVWCSVVTTEQARQLAGTLDDAGASLLSPQGPSYAFSSPGGSPEVDISFDPILPHELMGSLPG